MSEYRSLIKAIIDNGIIDYIKLQHPNNRRKTYLKDAYYTAIALFFDDSFRLETFSDENGDSLSLESALKIVLDGQLTSASKARQYVIKETIAYWYEKNFQNLYLPKTINIGGKTYFICNKKNSTAFIDRIKYVFYIDLSKKDSDRDFAKLCLQLLIDESFIELNTADFNSLNKFFYLFLKMNGCFINTTKQEKDDDPKG